MEKVIGNPFTNYVRPDELPKVVDCYTRRVAGEEVPPIVETVLRRKDGVKVYAELNADGLRYLEGDRVPLAGGGNRTSTSRENGRFRISS
jgi:PAS domain S-box-containing protein